MPNQGSPPPDADLTLPVKYLVKRPPIFVEPGATVAQAASIMQNARAGSLLVIGDPPGIVTDRDLRDRVLSAGLGPETPVGRVMTHPVRTIDSDSLVFTALQLMLQENIHHLVLVEEGNIVGVVSATDLLHHQAGSPFYLRRALRDLEDPTTLARYSRDIATAAQSLLRGGVGAPQIGQIVSTLNDTLVERLVQISERALGPPPTEFAWIVFGSEGRSEQTLLTDQDNALIYAEDSNIARTYFAALAERVVSGLIQVGFPPCPGGFMATNWCKPLAEWQQLFRGWIRLPEPAALLDAAIFFDFRAVAGALSLESLEQLIAGAKNEKTFLVHVMNGALVPHPPLGFFNRLRSENGAVDLKKGGIGPVVGLARAAALAAGSRERSTLQRLSVAGAAGAILNEASARDLAEIFPFLLGLRLRSQLAARESNQPLTNCVRLAELSMLERRHLKEAFIVIKQNQEFLGSRLDRLG